MSTTRTPCARVHWPHAGVALGVLAGLVAAFALAVLMPGALSAAGGTDRPFTGTLAGSAWAVPDTNCPLGVRTDSEASGTARHLGLISMASDHCFALPNLLTGGEMTFVAASGDELHLTYEGTADPPGLPVVGQISTVDVDLLVVGGTGRFAEATGEAQMTGSVLFTGFVTQLPATWTWNGTLSY